MSVFVANEWDIWYSYSTYLSDPVSDLHSAARELVSSGVAIAAVLQDGTCYWSGDEGEREDGRIIVTPLSRSASESRVTFPPNVEANALVFFREAAEFLANERHLFGVDPPLYKPYVRASLGIVRLTSREREVVLSTTLKLFENGLTLVSFRRYVSAGSLRLDEFVDKEVNLAIEDFDRVFASIPYSVLASRTYYVQRGLSIRDRFTFQRDERLHTIAISQYATTVSSPFGSFVVGPVTKYPGPERLSNLAGDIANVVAYVVSRRHTSVVAGWIGKQVVSTAGEYWRGRPHVHLLGFAGQRESVDDNEETHRDAFAAILSRGTGGVYPLPETLFRSGKTGSYIGLASSLWVHGRSVSPAMANSSVYPSQAVVELLEYGYMLNRRLLNQVSEFTTIDDVLSAKRDLLEFDLRAHESTLFGEVQEVLQKGWDAWGLQAVRSHIDHALALQETVRSLQETRMTNRWAGGLTLVFGVAAVPSVATDVLTPLWNLLRLPRPESDDGFTVLMLAVASVLIAMLLSALRRYYVRAGAGINEE